MGPQSSIAHFRILARLGQGGMGVVYRAEDQKLGRPVALKVLKTPDADGCYSESALRRFEREARAASALNHPNILTVYEIGEVDGAPYIATEYVEGATLRARLAAGPIPLGEALDIAMQSAGALAAAHTAGIVHRDIKPENIMVRPDGLVKVLDFGLAKLGEREKSHATDPEAETGTISLHETARGHVVGTPRYMSPEQARGLGVDARTDIFSLGVTIYEMAAGRRPFEGLTTSDVMASILKDQPPLFDAPAELQRILRKALEKNRDDRYQTPKDLQVDLKRLKQVLEDGGAGLTTGPPARTRRYRRSAAVVAIALATVGAGLFLYERSLPALGPKDMVLLTDFENQTGDTVFDNTLKHALTAQIEQSRYVTALPDVSVRETLAFMGQSREARVTPAIGREICRRNGLKAQVEGSIAALGTHYALSLAAVNAATGADIARVQTEADSKETVLHALGGAAGELRRKLGDSIASIRKYDAPLEATTTSLDALYAYSQGQTELHLLHNRAAMPYFQRAVELDPNFAEAWRSLANAHSNIDNMEEARAASQKAYDLRDRVSELERLVIESTYYHIRQDRQKVIEILEVAVHAYPRSLISWNNLANAYKRNGQDERSLAAFRALLAFAPQSAPYYSAISLLIGMNRLDEAKRMCAEAADRKMAPPLCFQATLYSALLSGDEAEVKRQVDRIAAVPNLQSRFSEQKRLAAFQGRIRDGRELLAKQRAACRDCNPNAPELDTDLLLAEATAGRCDFVASDFAASRPPVRHEVVLGEAVMAAALCHDTKRTDAFTAELAKITDLDPAFKNDVYLPCLRALAAGTRDPLPTAITSYKVTRKEMPMGGISTLYCRGQIDLAQGKGADAAAEFQTLVDNPGWQVLGSLYVPAYAALGRAAETAGDAARSRNAFARFFQLWKAADPDLPMLVAAKQPSGGTPSQ